ncbi:MAG: bifunctional folylpolyglutamate synthase/dihydrofolate synthase [Paenibacillaceae bacterium]|nr:bifunctional folylpolyglutamate synthase/dihydrofolate synthase [Paenibacillaceae bacterium]
MDLAESPAVAGFGTYEEAVHWITSRVSFGIRPGLLRMESLMERLGNPHRRLKFIHVAGTNGKGSTCAYLSAVIARCGYDVGTFTSPYLEKYTNRIKVNGADIGEADLLRLVNEMKPHVEAIAAGELGEPTMFEVSTALAILYFARVAYPDFVVWETGLGGRLDSTNIVTPILSVITNVQHDHMEILGDTLEKVAFEKAGIVKNGVPVVSAVEQPGVVETIEAVCRERKATLYLLGREFDYEPVESQLDRQTFDFRGPFRGLERLPITLNGSHQLKNAAVAVMALEVLRQYYALIVDDEELREGLAATQWPGRLEMVSEQPRILLDGAHNPEGAESLAAALRGVYRYRKLRFLMGMLSTKNHSGYLDHILPLVDTLIVTEPVWVKKMDASALADLARKKAAEIGATVEIVVEPDWKQALEQLKRSTGEDDLAVVAGTLYLISDVRSWILHKSDSEKGW